MEAKALVLLHRAAHALRETLLYLLSTTQNLGLLPFRHTRGNYGSNQAVPAYEKELRVEEQSSG